MILSQKCADSSGDFVKVKPFRPTPMYHQSSCTYVGLLWTSYTLLPHILFRPFSLPGNFHLCGAKIDTSGVATTLECGEGGRMFSLAANSSEGGLKPDDLKLPNSQRLDFPFHKSAWEGEIRISLGIYLPKRFGSPPPPKFKSENNP